MPPKYYYDDGKGTVSSYYKSLICQRCSSGLFLDSSNDVYVCKSCGLVSRTMPLPTLDRNFAYASRKDMNSGGDVVPWSEFYGVKSATKALGTDATITRNTNTNVLQRIDPSYESKKITLALSLVSDYLRRIDDMVHLPPGALSNLADRIRKIIRKCDEASKNKRIILSSNPIIIATACIYIVLTRDVLHRGIMGSSILSIAEKDSNKHIMRLVEQIDRASLCEDLRPDRGASHSTNVCERFLNRFGVPPYYIRKIIPLLKLALKEVWFFGRKPNFTIAAIMYHTLVGGCSLLTKDFAIEESIVSLAIINDLKIKESILPDLHVHVRNCHGC